ncbi:MAG: DUF3108 domain-containing protein [Acidobacteriota bacterium]
MKTALIFSLLAVPMCAETLHYSINWQSGLSLGEAALQTQKVEPAPTAESGEAPHDGGWNFQLTLDAAVPGFTIRDEYKSTTNSKLCSDTFERSLSHGARKSGEKIKFNQETHTITREAPGTKSQAEIPDCAHDALAFLQFVRQELAQGRLAPDQKVILGAAYNVRLTYIGTEALKQGNERIDADKVQAIIRGPKADWTVEIFFARNDVRTPLLARLPMALGTFTVELVP